MSKDPLAEATRALRESGPLNEFEVRATRTRVLNSLQQTRVRRRTRLAFLLPIAASFVAVSAWGAASGRGRAVLDQLEHFVGVTVRAPSRVKANPKTHAVSPIPSAHAPEPAELAPSHDAEPRPAVSVSIPAAATRAKASASASSGNPERTDPALTLYRVAHTAHFVERDPARALAAWDAYLRAAPSGAFAPEARYNRALSLVRLGRGKEAQSALEPFANGAYGEYRKAEARALLERIEP